MNDVKRNRIKGMLLGLIVGDCLGSPIQFSNKDHHKHISEMEFCPVFNVPAGYWTDDGSMAMCIMHSYLSKNKVDIADIADTFVEWLCNGRFSSIDGQSFDVGTATSSSLMNYMRSGCLKNGEEDDQGNGSIMRFAPSYLIANGNNDIMHSISDITHHSSKIHEVIDKFASILDLHLDGKKMIFESEYRSRDEVNNSGWAVSSLEAAIWAFNTTSSFEDCLVEAVNLGGDSDTIGAIAGQIAGAYYGFDAIPSRWVNKIKDYKNVVKMIDDFIDAYEKNNMKV